MATSAPSGTMVVPAYARNFGKYQLAARLATGGMAEIFLARLRGLAGFERFVVIKRILPHLDEDENFKSMFIDEARIAARISHPNVCQVYELGEVAGQYYLAMEYLEGVTLNQAMRKLSRDRLAPDVRLVGGLLMQACEGLHSAHELRDPTKGPLNIVHRDVTPHNLFVTVDGLLKVLDFGIAKAQGASSRTRTGTVKGKYAYMPPEQLRGESLDRRTDVWALGVVLFEALTGKRLFWRDTDFLIFRAITDEAIPRVRDFRPDVPPALDEAVACALTRKKEARFPNARAFGEAITASLAPLGGPLGQSAISSEIARIFGEELEGHRALVTAAIRECDEPIPGGDPTPPPVLGPGDGSASRKRRSMAGESMTSAASPSAAARRANTAPRPALPLPAPEETRVADAGGELEILSHDTIDDNDDLDDTLDPLTSPIPPVVLTPAAPPPRRRRWPFVMGAGGVAIGAVVIMAMRGSAPPPPPPAEPSTLPATTVITVDAAPPPLPSIDGAPPAPVDAGVPDAAPLVVAPKPDRPKPDRPKPDRPKPDKPPDPTPAGPPGFLVMNSNPYATLYIDGKNVGDTPLANYELKAGTHRVKAVSAKGTKEFTIRIESGKTLRYPIRWD